MPTLQNEKNYIAIVNPKQNLVWLQKNFCGCKGKKNLWLQIAKQKLQMVNFCCKNLKEKIFLQIFL